MSSFGVMYILYIIKLCINENILNATFEKHRNYFLKYKTYVKLNFNVQ